MIKTSSIIKTSTISFISAVQIFSLFAVAIPSAVYAQDAAPACATGSGSQAPTGASGHTYSWNATTCLWENAYYTWNPVTNKYTAKYDQTPKLSADGTAWEYPKWVYVASTGAYKLRTISEIIPIEATTANDETGTKTTNTPGMGGNPAVSNTLGSNTIDGTGAQSTNLIDSNNSNDYELNSTNNTSVNNLLNSSAITGNANVNMNTNGGSASTGDATVVANYINMIHSNWDAANGPIATFDADITGINYGDLLFNPNTVMNTGVESDNQINNNNETNLKINVEENADINNDINIEAVSGDATVSKNTNAGSATTGDATATANLINMINSAINSPNGFIGNINIYGDLDGDLLLPASVMAMLGNTGADSNNTVTNENSQNLDANIDNNYAINNDVDLNAESGDANVWANTNAGDATSGNASTNVQQENYVGQSAFGLSGLLIMVNALGDWTGSINPILMQISDTGADSNNEINNQNESNTDINYSENFSINNNINANAKSGDATVAMNTNAGDATSGNAQSNANIINLINSDINYSEWFGVLFINVFGTWNGSFGTDTEAGENASTKQNNSSNNTNSSNQSNDSDVNVVLGVSTSSSGSQGTSSGNQYYTNTVYEETSEETEDDDKTVATLAGDNNPSVSQPETTTQETTESFTIGSIALPASIALAIIAFLNRGTILAAISRSPKV